MVTSASVSIASQETGQTFYYLERQLLLNDVEAFCEDVRPTEELCYLEHRFNEQAIELAKKYNLLGMAVEKQYGGRGADARAVRHVRDPRSRTR